MIRNRYIVDEDFVKAYIDCICLYHGLKPKPKIKVFKKIFIILGIFLYIITILDIIGRTPDSFTIALGLIMGTFSLFMSRIPTDPTNMVKVISKKAVIKLYKNIINKELCINTDDEKIEVSGDDVTGILVLSWRSIKSYMKDGDYLLLCSDELGKKPIVPYNVRSFSENELTELITILHDKNVQRIK